MRYLKTATPKLIVEKIVVGKRAECSRKCWELRISVQIGDVGFFFVLYVNFGWNEI